MRAGRALEIRLLEFLPLSHSASIYGSKLFSLRREYSDQGQAVRIGAPDRAYQPGQIPLVFCNALGHASCVRVPSVR